MIDHEEFLLLPLSQLIEICSSDELNVRSEEQVYQAIMVWVKHSIVERRQHLPVVRNRLSTLFSFPICKPAIFLFFRFSNTSDCPCSRPSSSWARSGPTC